MSTLLNLRQKIEALDLDLLSYLKKRAEYVQEIAALKQKSALPLKDLEREAFLLEKMIQKNDTGFADEDVLSIYKAIINASIALQQKIN